jgi:SAM-dependent methyltransferase
MKTRGLETANKKLGNLVEIVEQIIKRKGKAKIFESGPGYGLVMIELAKRFGDKIEIIGMNLKPEHGNKSIMIKYALKRKIIDKSDLATLKFPKFIYGDAGEKLPFKTESIDLVYSQTSVYLYKDKMHFFEEVARVLSKKGISRITGGFYSGEEGIAPEFRSLIKIYGNGREIQAKDYVKKFRLFKIVNLRSGKQAIQINPGKLDFNLKLEATININHIYKNKWGMQSIYTIN